MSKSKQVVCSCGKVAAIDGECRECKLSRLADEQDERNSRNRNRPMRETVMECSGKSEYFESWT